jgi:hypothetical protein
MQTTTAQSLSGHLAPFRRRKANQDAAAVIHAVRVGGDAHPRQVPHLGIPAVVDVDIDVEAAAPVAGVNLSLSLKRASGEIVSVMLSRDARFDLDLRPGVNCVRCRIGGLYLVPGRYVLDVGITPEVGRLAWDVIFDYPAFDVFNEGPGALAVRVQRPGAVLCPDVVWTAVS